MVKELGDIEDVSRHLERLALIKFTDDERVRLSLEIRKILNFFNQLNELGDLKDVEPLFHVLDIESPLRDDEPEVCSIPASELLSNALREGSYVKGPRTVTG